MSGIDLLPRRRSIKKYQATAAHPSVPSFADSNRPKQRIRRSLAGLDRQGESRHSALIMPLVAQKGKGLSGEIPSFSSALELSVLRLDGNSFSGKLPSLPPSIQEVRLQRNEIHGSVPEGYGELPHLHTLKAESNKLSGSIPTGRCGCS